MDASATGGDFTSYASEILHNFILLRKVRSLHFDTPTLPFTFGLLATPVGLSMAQATTLWHVAKT